MKNIHQNSTLPLPSQLDLDQVRRTSVHRSITPIRDDNHGGGCAEPPHDTETPVYFRGPASFRACLMMGRAGFHRPSTLIRYDNFGGIVCIRQDMKRRSGNLGRRLSCRRIGAAECPDLGAKPTQIASTGTSADRQNRKCGLSVLKTACRPKQTFAAKVT